MKSRLALLVGCLFLLTTPIFALAHGGERHAAPQQYKGWESNHQDQGKHYRNARQHSRERRATKHFKQQRRQRKFARRHHRPHYVSAPVVIYSVPRIVFRLDW